MRNLGDDAKRIDSDPCYGRKRSRIMTRNDATGRVGCRLGAGMAMVNVPIHHVATSNGFSDKEKIG